MAEEIKSNFIKPFLKYKQMNQYIILFIIITVIVIVMLLTGRKQHINKQEVVDTLRKSGGWIEVLDMQNQLLFQGWLYTVTKDSYGIAVGVLIEKNRNPTLIQDLKKARKIEYLEDSKILAKVLIDFERNLVFGDLTDVNLQSTLQNIVSSNKEIDVMLQIDSEGISFTENPEDEETFTKVWQPNSNSPSINTSDKTITSTIQK